MGRDRPADVLGHRLHSSGHVPFFCECAQPYCDGRVDLRPDDWEHIAAEPNQYVIVAGHPRAEGETVVRLLGSYEVVLATDDMPD